MEGHPGGGAGGQVNGLRGAGGRVAERVLQIQRERAAGAGGERLVLARGDEHLRRRGRHHGLALGGRGQRVAGGGGLEVAAAASVPLKEMVTLLVPAAITVEVMGEPPQPAAR